MNNIIDSKNANILPIMTLSLFILFSSPLTPIIPFYFIIGKNNTSKKLLTHKKSTEVFSVLFYKLVSQFHHIDLSPVESFPTTGDSDVTDLGNYEIHSSI